MPILIKAAWMRVFYILHLCLKDVLEFLSTSANLEDPVKKYATDKQLLQDSLLHIQKNRTFRSRKYIRYCQRLGTAVE